MESQSKNAVETTNLASDSSTDDETDPMIFGEPETASEVTRNCTSESDMANDSDIVNEESGESVWEDEDEAGLQEDLTSKSARAKTTKQKIQSLTSWLLLSILFLQAVYSLSNACVEQFLFLFSQLFSVLGQFSEFCSSLASVFPVGFHAIRRYLNFSGDEFTKYVVCNNCFAIHSFDKVLVNGEVICKNRVFACRAFNSSRKRGRSKCNGVLARKIILKNDTAVLYPYKIFCLKGVIGGLERLINRKGFIDMCGKWRKREVQDLYADIYDGNVWKSFISRDGSDFLEKNYHFGLAINVDWFSPYKRRRDLSIGAIYMVVLNLPREERFKSENTILLAIIPALRKEPDSLNSFLEPIVAELKALWRGVLMPVPGFNDPVYVKSALMCAAADIPAARKLCGFLGHSARQGCSQCTKPFINMGEKDCGVPDLNLWPARNRSDHVKYSKLSLDAETLTGKSMIEGRYGYRYTALLELDYFIPSQFYAIDPMHNLFLGTAKRLFCHWVDQGILSKLALESISERILKFHVTHDIGRMPTNIVSNYGQMTAKEWKNWVLIYSMFCLKGNLSSSHLKVWQTFVLACKHICKPIETKENIEVAHRLFVKFVTEVGRLYGCTFVTPNMHLHCHLKDTVENFGSVYGFWLFSFERYNGILSGFPTNKRSIECQLMRRFEMASFLSPSCTSDEYAQHFIELSQMSQTKRVKTASVNLLLVPTIPITTICSEIWCNLSLCSFSGKSFRMLTLSALDLQHLTQTYSIMYDETVTSTMLSSIGKKYMSIEYSNQIFGASSNGESGKSSVVWASWADANSDISPFYSRPAKLKYFLYHSVELSPDNFKSHVFAVVEWYKICPFETDYLSPCSVWSTRTQNDGPATYLPVQRISAKCAWATETINGRPCMVTVELPNCFYV